MKGQAIEIIKDLIVSLLIIVSIVIILSLVFYDDIALGKVVPQAEDYTLSAEMQNELEYTELDDAEEVIINYYIDASDLKKYEKTNEYIKGKSNPFAEVNNSETVNNTTTEGNNTITGGNNTSSGTNENNNGNGGFYEDDGTK